MLKPHEETLASHQQRTVDKTPTILIADDDRQLARILADFLMDRSYSVAIAYDGEETMEFLRKNGVALLILDLKMPRIDGLSISKFVKKSVPSTKVLVLTGYADLRSRNECRRLGADEFISKPYSLNNVLDALSELGIHQEGQRPIKESGCTS